MSRRQKRRKRGRRLQHQAATRRAPTRGATEVLLDDAAIDPMERLRKKVLR